MASIYELVTERSCLRPIEEYTVEEHLMDIPLCEERGSGTSYIFTPTDELEGVIDQTEIIGKVTVMEELSGVISNPEILGTINDEEIVGEIINENIEGNADC